MVDVADGDFSAEVKSWRSTIRKVKWLVHATSVCVQVV